MPDDNNNGTADALRYPQYGTNGAHEIFEAPPSDPRDWWKESAASLPQQTMTRMPSTSIEAVRKQAELRQKQSAQEEDKLNELLLEDMGSSAAGDAEPSMMAFFNGKSYADGRAAYNAARIARGLAPLPEGRR